METEFSSRLITLCDGRQGIRGGVHVEIREPDTASKSTLDFVASDETIDRYNEIISASGWNLANYQLNPVFQNAHQYGDILFTLGKAVITEIRSRPSTINGQSGSDQPSTCLYQRIQFATDVNPMAKIAYGLYRGRFLNAVSVGFVPVRWVNGDGKEHNSSSRSDASSSIQRFSDSTSSRSSGYRRKYIEQELLEVSAVGIPANPTLWHSPTERV